MDSFVLLFLPGISNLDIENLPINEHDGYCTIAIKVMPRSFKTEFVGIESGRMKIKCNSPALKGKANNEVIGFLAEILRLPKNLLEIVNGVRSHHKVIKIYKIKAAEIRSIIKKMEGKG